MPSQIDKLIEHINQLTIWLRENPNTTIPAQEKTRLSSILTKIKEREEMTTEEWELLKPKKEIK